MNMDICDTTDTVRQPERRLLSVGLVYDCRRFSCTWQTQPASFGYSSGDEFKTDLLRRASPSSQCVGTEAFSALMTVSSSFVILISDPIWLISDAIWLFSDVVCCARSFVCGFFAGSSTFLLANTSGKGLGLATFFKVARPKLAGCLTGSSAATDYSSD